MEIFVGDININIMNKLSNETITYLDISSENGFSSYINEPTRMTEDSSLIIDHFFVRLSGTQRNARLSPIVFQTNLTDHYFIFLSILQDEEENLCTNKPRKKIITKINFEKLNEILENENWNDVSNCLDSQLANDLFIDEKIHKLFIYV